MQEGLHFNYWCGRTTAYVDTGAGTLDELVAFLKRGKEAAEAK